AGFGIPPGVLSSENAGPVSTENIGPLSGSSPLLVVTTASAPPVSSTNRAQPFNTSAALLFSACARFPLPAHCSIAGSVHFQWPHNPSVTLWRKRPSPVCRIVLISLSSPLIRCFPTASPSYYETIAQARMLSPYLAR